MKRSTINRIIRDADEFIASFQFHLPPFARWTPAEFRGKAKEAAEIIKARDGWDVTDFGGGRFDEVGLALLTLRNGEAADLARGKGMLYAEKLLICRRGQITPNHRHNIKAEDIIVRGGGRCAFVLHMSDRDGGIDRKAEVTVHSDGVLKRLPAGGKLVLGPGESVTLLPGVWHTFWAEDRDALLGEVSTVNDDVTDNVFEEAIGRFADIEEDEPPYRVLVSDYDRFFR